MTKNKNNFECCFSTSNDKIEFSLRQMNFGRIFCFRRLKHFPSIFDHANRQTANFDEIINGCIFCQFGFVPTISIFQRMRPGTIPHKARPFLKTHLHAQNSFGHCSLSSSLTARPSDNNRNQHFFQTNGPKQNQKRRDGNPIQYFVQM